MPALCGTKTYNDSHATSAHAPPNRAPPRNPVSLHRPPVTLSTLRQLVDPVTPRRSTIDLRPSTTDHQPSATDHRRPHRNLYCHRMHQISIWLPVRAPVVLSSGYDAVQRTPKRTMLHLASHPGNLTKSSSQGSAVDGTDTARHVKARARDCAAAAASVQKNCVPGPRDGKPGILLFVAIALTLVLVVVW